MCIDHTHMSKTTILVDNTTRELLRQIGRKNQTYDQLLNELIKTKKDRKTDSLESRIETLQSSESTSTQERISL